MARVNGRVFQSTDLSAEKDRKNRKDVRNTHEDAGLSSNVVFSRTPEDTCLENEAAHEYRIAGADKNADELPSGEDAASQFVFRNTDPVVDDEGDAADKPVKDRQRAGNETVTTSAAAEHEDEDDTKDSVEMSLNVDIVAIDEKTEEFEEENDREIEFENLAKQNRPVQLAVLNKEGENANENQEHRKLYKFIFKYRDLEEKVNNTANDDGDQSAGGHIIKQDTSADRDNKEQMDRVARTASAASRPGENIMEETDTHNLTKHSRSDETDEKNMKFTRPGKEKACCLSACLIVSTFSFFK